MVKGDKVVFVYPNYGTPDMHPDYTKHSGQQVEIIRELSLYENHSGVPIFEIKASDGWVGHAWEDELSNL